MRSVIMVVAFASLGLAACQAPTHQQLGGIGGSAVGAMVGNQFGSGAGNLGATMVGAGVGGLVGSNVGRSLDQRARQNAQSAESRALDSGRPAHWQSAKEHGEIVPGPIRQVNGRQCRNYTHQVWIDGRSETIRGGACRMPDGTWQPA